MQQQNNSQREGVKALYEWYEKYLNGGQRLFDDGCNESEQRDEDEDADCNYLNCC